MIALQRSRPEDREVTLYVKGFLSRGESADHFQHWLEGHRTLVEAHGWGERAYGYDWSSGQLAGWPLPLASAAKTAWDWFGTARHLRRGAIVANLGWFVAEELAWIALRFAHQYRSATAHASERADRLAGRLDRLADRYARVRVVAHSLGCRQVIEAAALLPRERRPHQVHLLAPACREDEVRDKLADLAREQCALYYSSQDLVLESGFRLLSLGRALGASGPAEVYPRLVARDVSEHFGFWVHGEYKRRFPELAHPEAIDAS